MKAGRIAVSAAAMVAAVVMVSSMVWAASARDEVESRGRGDRARAERPERPERPAPPERPRTEAPEVRPAVFQFQNIPAESFLETLKQLAANPHIREMVEQTPIALNEPANAVVVIAPPPVLEALGIIAKGLDQPNSFHERMQKREMAERMMHGKMEQMERGGPPPPAGPRPAMGQGPKPGMCPMCAQMMEKMKAMQEKMAGMKGGMGEGGPKPPHPEMKRPKPGEKCPMCGQMMGPKPEGPKPPHMEMKKPEAKPASPPTIRFHLGGQAAPRPGGQSLESLMEKPGPRPEMRRPEARPAEKPEPRRSAPAEAPSVRGQWTGPGAWFLATPRAAAALDLSENQVRQIRETMDRLGETLLVQTRTLRERLSSASPEARRSEEVQALVREFQSARQALIAEAQKKVLSILSPAQREKLEKLTPGAAAPAPAPRPEARPEPKPQARPARPMLRPMGSDAAAPGAPRFYLIQDTGEAPQSSSSTISIQVLSDGQGGAAVITSGDGNVQISEGPGGSMSVQGSGQSVTVDGVTVQSSGGQGGGGGRFFMSGRAGRIALLADPEVQNQLGLSAEQRQTLADLAAEASGVYERAREKIMGTLQPAGAENMTPEEQMQAREDAAAARMEAFQAAREEATDLMDIAEKVLTDDQRAQLDQIAADRRQAMAAGAGPGGGLWALTRDTTARELGLSQEQVGQIRSILRESYAGMGEMMRERMASIRDLPPEQRSAAMQETWNTMQAKRAEAEEIARAKVMQVLTPEQQKAAAAYVTPSRGKTITRTLPQKPAETAPAPAPAPEAAPPVQPGAAPATSTPGVIG